MTRIRTAAALLTLLAAITTAACTPTAPTSPNHAATQLDLLTVIASRPTRADYERSCRHGHRCVFGPAWSDDVDVPQGHNSCDQASDVLRAALTDPGIKPHTHGCTPLPGTLHDPYTGRVIHYHRGQRPIRVSIDHVVSLKAAWDFGAADWPLQKRRNFAGDPDNLIAVSATANSAKGDDTPSGGWRPRPAFRCTYAQRYTNVLAKYRLPFTRQDKNALKQMLGTCRTR